MCRLCREPRGGRALRRGGERGPGVWGRCKHNLLPPKPACSLGERAPPAQPTWHPGCQGLGSLQAQADTSPHLQQPLPLAFPPSIWNQSPEAPSAPEQALRTGLQRGVTSWMCVWAVSQPRCH